MMVMDEQVFLIVEHDRLSREALKRLLTHQMGHEKVWMFGDSCDFMMRVRHLPEKPTVFLLDVHARPCDGFEMLAALRSAPGFHDATIIAITPGGAAGEIEMLRSSGFDGIIGKPIIPRDFPEQIARYSRAGQAV
jgi:CheY-like chemotaxis protein